MSADSISEGPMWPWSGLDSFDIGRSNTDRYDIGTCDMDWSGVGGFDIKRSDIDRYQYGQMPVSA